MRCLTRDMQLIYISNYENKEPILDDEGRDTGEYKIVRSEPVPVFANVSAASGSAQAEVFGTFLNYDRTVIIDNKNFEVSETAVLWIDKDTSKEHDYIVKRIAKTPNYLALAVSRVDVRNNGN